jgi:ABC-type branched-subunit amino acid transport system permease subunit
MASLAGTTLLWRGTLLDRIWVLNLRAYNQLVPLNRAIGIPFLVLAVAVFVAGIGWFRHRRSGWNLAVAIIAIQVAGDVLSVIMGEAIRGVTGATIAGALVSYITRRPFRAAFKISRTPNTC